MCTPMAAAGAALTVGGQVMNNRAQNKAAGQRQDAINRQTALSAEEFDTRYAAANEGDARVNELTERGYQERGDLEDSTFNTLIAAENNRIARDSGLVDNYYGSIEDLLSTQVTDMGAARDDFNNLVEAERAKQAGFRGQADAGIDTLISGLGTSSLNAERANQSRARMDLAALAQTDSGPVAPGPLTGTPLTDRLIAFNTEQVNNEAARDAGRNAQILAYSDAALEGNRAIDRTGEDMRFLDLESRASANALGYNLAPSRLKYQNASERAAAGRNRAQSDLDGRLRLSAGELEAATVPLKRYADRVDQALADYYRSRLTSESDFTQNVIGSSSRYEDVNRNLTNYRVSNISGESPVGNLLSGAGSSMLSAGIGGAGPSWGDIGSLADDPFGVVGPTGPQQPSTWLGQMVY